MLLFFGRFSPVILVQINTEDVFIRSVPILFHVMQLCAIASLLCFYYLLELLGSKSIGHKHNILTLRNNHKT